MSAGTTAPDLYRQLLDGMPMPIFVVDRDLKVLDHNRAARELLAVPVESARDLRGGHILHCLNAIKRHEGCGQTPFCATCGLRNALEAAARSDRTVHTRATMRLVHGGAEEEHIFRITVAPLAHGGESRWLLIMDDRTEQAELEQLFPVCSSCGETRDSEQLRNKAAAYLRKHPEADPVLTLCPACRERLHGHTA